MRWAGGSIAFAAWVLLMGGCRPADEVAITRPAMADQAVQPTPTAEPRLESAVPDPVPPAATPAPEPSPAVAGKAEYRFVLESTAIARIGQTLPVKLSYTNTSGAPQTFRLTSGQRWDLALDDAGGRRRLVWSADKMFTMALRGVRVAPGETIGDTLELDIPVSGIDPGDYTLVGSLGGGFKTSSTPMPITVTR